MKVCEKSHIHREKMQKAILREKQIMKYLTEKQSKFFIKLLSTFQDDTRLCMSIPFYNLFQLIIHNFFQISFCSKLLCEW